MKGDKKKKSLKDFFLCDSYRIQTYNLLIRSQMLYSVELRSQVQLLCARCTHCFKIVTPIGFKPITF